MIDLYRICRLSKKGAVLYRDVVPMTRGSDFESAAREGEDFELLFTLSRNSDILRAKKRPGFKITRIGEITGGRGAVFIKSKGVLTKVEARGYYHFN